MNTIKQTLRDSAVARWAAVILISIMMFSSYCFYDIFAAIKPNLQAQTGMDNTDYGFIVGAYSFTNVFLAMAFIGGIILDRWGIRKSGSVFITFLFIGTFLTAYGATGTFSNGGFGYEFFSSFLKQYSPELKIMVLGRLLFGLGAETFYVIIDKAIAKWFKGKELALAFAISLGFGRLGTVMALMLSTRLVPDVGMGPIDNAMWFGIVITFVAVICFLGYLIYDVKLDKSKTEKVIDEEEKFNFKEFVGQFSNKSFIYTTLLCIMFYAAVFPFINFAPDLLQNKFGMNPKASGDWVTILPLGTLIFTPIFGWFCDNKGKSATLMIMGSLLLIVSHLTFSLTNLTPIIPLFMLGIAFALVPAAMWPAVARIIPGHLLGTAYGFMFTVQNLGLLGVPILIGKILDIVNKNNQSGEPLDYTLAILLLSVLGILGIVFAILLKKDDKKHAHGLELPNKTK